MSAHSNENPLSCWQPSAASTLVKAFVLTIAVLTTVFASSGIQAEANSLAVDADITSDAVVRHEIDFGHSIDIEFEIGTQAAIAEVRAIFAPRGLRRISSYAYPELFSAEQDHIAGRFTIATGGASYIPPGTEFDVSFELTEADGSVTTTTSERILYLDPTKDWQRLSIPDAPLDFYYYGFSASVANGLSSRVSSNWRDIADSIGLESESLDRFRAVIYPDINEMNDVFPPTSAAASDGIFFGGFAMQRYGVFVLGGPWADSVIHELTHLLIDTKVNSPLSPGVPSWLHEGLAQFFETGDSNRYTSQLGRAASNDNLVTLYNRNTVPAQRDQISLFYTQVGSFVGELIEDHGPERMAQTLTLINQGREADEAVEVAYGKSLWELENEWRVRLGASELPPPLHATATPGSEVTGSGDSAPQSTATVVNTRGAPDATAAIDGVGASASEGGDSFNWTGPLIGAAIAGVVFFVWSYRVNRRRFGKARRR